MPPSLFSNVGLSTVLMSVVYILIRVRVSGRVSHGVSWMRVLPTCSRLIDASRTLVTMYGCATIMRM